MKMTATGQDELPLLQWARERGAWISDKLELKHTAYGGRSFFARVQIEQGEELARLPTTPDFVLTQAFVRAHPSIGAAIQRCEAACGHALDVEEVLAVYLAAVKLGQVDAATSPWRTYIDALPTSPPNVPVLWDDALLRLLPDPRSAIKGKALLDASKTRATLLLLSLAADADGVDGVSPLTPTAPEGTAGAAGAGERNLYATK